jgi:hypothetical protein
MAEVAVAFAGFASLISVLGRHSSRDDPRVLAVRMRAMILSSLIVVIFSLLPVVLNRYGLDEPTTWHMASILLLAATTAFVAFIARSVQLLLRFALPKPRWVGYPVFTLLSSAFLLAAANATFISASARSAVYLTSLLLLLLLASLAFGLIVFAFLPSIRGD